MRPSERINRWRWFDDWWCRPADLWDDLEEAGYFAAESL